MLDLSIEKIYYGRKTILKNINLNFKNTGLYGFFGKNGSGKTTFLKTFIKTVSFDGKIKLNGKDFSEKNVAWIPTEPFLYEYLTIKEFYDFYAFTVKDLPVQSDFVFDIDSSKLLKECSTGTKKKAYINAVLQYTNYNLYIFDEPFNGLDIESNYILLKKIIDLSKENIVFISSHIIEIIEPYLEEKYFVENSELLRIDDHVDIKNRFINE